MLNWDVLRGSVDEPFLLKRVLSFIRVFLPPRRYLEIGVKDGDSLLCILHPGLEEVVLCDTWTDMYGGSAKGSHEHISDLLSDYPCTVTFLDGESQETIPKHMQGNLCFFDLALVDGDHSYEGCKSDLENCADLLKIGGYIVVDDIMHPAHLHLDECVSEFVSTSAYQVVFRSNIGYGVVVLQRSA